MTTKRPLWAGPSWYGEVQMTPAEHLRVAARLRQLTDNPKAEELALHHEQLARIIQKRGLGVHGERDDDR